MPYSTNRGMSISTLGNTCSQVGSNRAATETEFRVEHPSHLFPVGHPSGLPVPLYKAPLLVIDVRCVAAISAVTEPVCQSGVRVSPAMTFAITLIVSPRAPAEPARSPGRGPVALLSAVC